MERNRARCEPLLEQMMDAGRQGGRREYSSEAKVSGAGPMWSVARRGRPTRSSHRVTKSDVEWERPAEPVCRCFADEAPVTHCIPSRHCALLNPSCPLLIPPSPGSLSLEIKAVLRCTHTHKIPKADFFLFSFLCCVLLEDRLS